MSSSSFVRQLAILKEMQAYYSRHTNPVTGAPLATPAISQAPKVFPPAPRIPSA